MWDAEKTLLGHRGFQWARRAEGGRRARREPMPCEAICCNARKGQASTSCSFQMIECKKLHLEFGCYSSWLSKGRRRARPSRVPRTCLLELHGSMHWPLQSTEACSKLTTGPLTAWAGEAATVLHDMSCVNCGASTLHKRQTSFVARPSFQT